MTDPWAEFVAASEGERLAGYFESQRYPGAPGAARWFAEEARSITIGRATRAAAVEAEIQQHLTDHPRGVTLGYLGFDAAGVFEPLLREVPRGSPFPGGELVLVERPRTMAVERPRIRPRNRRPPPEPQHDTLDRDRFRTSVRNLQRAIDAGEAFQVVLSRRRTWERPDDLLAKAGELRASERYSFFFYLRLGSRELLGASPEAVVVSGPREAAIDPIAGTRPRHEPVGERPPLSQDPKELAEHRMLIDLARNDLGRVAEPGSVRLEFRERRVRFATVEHLVSRVRADLPPKTSRWGVLGASFPAGTVSGAPKIRATRLLRREERTWRGPYGGAVGWIDALGRSEWALAIRSAFAAGDRLYTAAGAGIVHASEPEREFEETEAKLARVEEVLLGGSDR
jgi:anthranilate/para-aminobenzoate synthase component I